MVENNKILFDLIRCGVNDLDIGEIESYLDDETIKKVLKIAEKHDISQIVTYALSKNKTFEDNEVYNYFNNKMLLAIYLYEQRKFVLSEISKVFNENKIIFIPLKGSVVSNFYSESWMRTSCDIDVLIHENDVSVAANCLDSLGFKLQKSNSSHDYSFFSQNGIHLELHFNLLQEDCLENANKLLKEVWNYTCNNNDYNKSLTNEFFIFYHVAHMAKHFIKGGCGIRPFIDLWLMYSNMDFDSFLLEKMLSNAGLIDFYYSINYTIDVWFKGKTHNQVTFFIEEYIMNGGVYGTYHNISKIAASTGESKLRSFLKLMFLPKSNLECIYPIIEKHPFLYPYYQVKRWFGFFDKTRRNRVKKLVQLRNSISDYTINSTKELLESLGLEDSIEK